ncbi:NAD-dependent protein deacetylase [Streptomyces griseomycini]
MRPVRGRAVAPGFGYTGSMTAVGTESRLADRILGGWTGRIAGNMLGKPVEQGEVWTRERIDRYLRRANALPLTDYLPESATVMFGERLDPVVLGEALAISKACTVFVAVGTSLQVHPAAGLAGVAADHGARLIVVNAEPTPYDDRADEVVREPIGTALPGLLRRLAAEGAS